MNKQSDLTLKILLWLIAVYHLIAGAAGTFSKDAAVTIGSLFFGVGITMNEQTELLVRYLGAFSIAFGVMATLAALAPARNRTFIWGAVAYFVVRAFDRVVFAGLFSAHAVGSIPNWWRICVILAFAVGLLLLMPRKQAHATSTGG